MFGFLILFFFLLFGEEILRIIDIELYSYKFQLILYSISQFLVILFGPLALFMKLSDNQTKIRNILFFNTIFHIVLSFVLSYLLGKNGVYYAIILGNLLWCYIIYRYIKDKYGFAL
jgi:O-antigen/teichoic acid export membrane protein